MTSGDSSSYQHGPGGWRRGMLVVLSIAIAAACNAKGKQAMKPKAEETLTSLGKETGVLFPASAKLIGVHREQGMDDLIAVKVEMPAAEWPAFLARTPIEPALFAPGEQGLLGPDRDFWDPHQAKGLRAAQALLPQRRTLNVGYVERGAVVVVYVVNHGT